MEKVQGNGYKRDKYVKQKEGEEEDTRKNRKGGGRRQ
jgi:hypothetical protein